MAVPPIQSPTMQANHYPGDLSEIQFVQAYCDVSLRKPQVVADSALRTIVTSVVGDRLILVGLLAEQLGEACRRLTAVHLALADRRLPVGRSLLAPLPGLAAWRQLTQQAATFTPEQMLRELSLGEDALASARKLREQPDLASLDPIVAAAEGDAALFVLPSGDSRRDPDEILFVGRGPGDEELSVALGTAEGEAAILADITADLTVIARGFLGAYCDSRRSAGRRD